MTATILNETDLDAVKSLLDTTVDAKESFEVMANKAEPEFRPVARKFEALHSIHAQRLSQTLSINGRDPSGAGTLMGSVNEAAISIRALFDEIDADVMDSVRRGEKNVFKAFDKALEGDMTNYRHDLAGMRFELQTLVNETAHLD